MAYQVDISEQDIQALFDVRGDLASVFDTLGLPLPETVNTGSRDAGVEFYRVGPDRCLVRAPIEPERELGERLIPASDSHFANVTCVSDMFQGVVVRGQDCLSVLAQVTPLDVAMFERGAATRTELFGTAGFLFREDEREFTLYFEHSFFDYAHERLRRCALLDDGNPG